MRRFNAEVLPAETLDARDARVPGRRDGTCTKPRVIRWTLPTGRHYDVIDDHDPAAAIDETAYLHHLIRRADILIAKQDHARRQHHQRLDRERRKHEQSTTRRP